MQVATENCHHPELVGELQRLELIFFPLEHVTELIVLGEGMSLVAVDKFGVGGEKHLKWRIFLSSKHSTVPHYSSVGTVLVLKSFPSDYVPTFENDTFAIIHTQPSNMHGEHWIKIAHSRQKIVFCRLSWSYKVQFPQAAKRTDNARTTTVRFQCFRFLHDICSFSTLQNPTRRNYRSSRC